MEEIIFRNSNRYINEGKLNGKGLLYCGAKYTCSGGCPCGQCDGYCGLTNGCPCPDCDNTLSYILYSTGKMNCGVCNKNLIRLKLLDLKNIDKSKKRNITRYTCKICYQSYSNENYVPLFHCFKCDYNMCSKCAFKKISSFEPEIPKIEKGFNLGKGMLYCRKNYTTDSSCICGGCDGNCGEENGCPCPLCDAILGYNIYLKSNDMNCSVCKSLRIKTTVFLLQKANVNVTPCILCSHKFNKDSFQAIYHCNKCKKNVCCECAFKNNILDIKNLSYPKIPIFLGDMEKKLNDKKNEELKNAIKICRQKKFRIIDKKVKGTEINIYLKTLVGRIYTITLEDNEDVSKIKDELGKLDKKFLNSDIILLYKNKKLEDTDNLLDVGIGNESLINFILK